MRLSCKARSLPPIPSAGLLPSRRFASRVSDRGRSVVKLSVMTRNVPDPAQTRRRVARAWPLMRAATRAPRLYVQAVMRLAPGRARTRLLRGTWAYLVMLEQVLRCLLVLMGRKATQPVQAAWAVGLSCNARSTRPGAVRVFSVALGKAFAGAFRPRPIPAPPPSRPLRAPVPRPCRLRPAPVTPASRTVSICWPRPSEIRNRTPCAWPPT